MDSETPEGLRLLYDLLVKAAEYPGESPHNPRNLYNWGQKLKGLEHILSGYLDEEYMHEKFREFQQELDLIDSSNMVMKNGRPALTVKCDECRYEWNYTGGRKVAQCPSIPLLFIYI